MENNSNSQHRFEQAQTPQQVEPENHQNTQSFKPNTYTQAAVFNINPVTAKRQNRLFQLCLSGIIAALYATLTLTVYPFAYGPIQFRPAEALTLLPLLLTSTVPALFVGCFIANLFSPYGGILDAVIGGGASLVAAILTYLVTKLPLGKNPTSVTKLALGAVPPIILNALLIPVVIILADPAETFASYFAFAGSIGLTQLAMIVILGMPLTFALSKNKYLMQFSHYSLQQTGQ